MEKGHNNKRENKDCPCGIHLLLPNRGGAQQRGEGGVGRLFRGGIGQMQARGDSSGGEGLRYLEVIKIDG